MTRVKRGTTSLKRRRSILKRTKGYTFGRKSKEREAKQAFIRAGQHALAHRRKKKGDFRRLWNIKINAAARPLGISYSRLLARLRERGIAINRKMLAEYAEHEPDTFKKIAKQAVEGKEER